MILHQSVLVGVALLTVSQLSPLGAATLLHRWSFDTLEDPVGGADVTFVGGASLAGGQLELPGGGVRTNYASVDVGATVATATSLSVESRVQKGVKLKFVTRLWWARKNRPGATNCQEF